MRKTDRYKLLLLQRIRFRRSEMTQDRSRKQKAKRLQTHSTDKKDRVSSPRNFVRWSNSTEQVGKVQNFSQRKSDCLSRYLPVNLKYIMNSAESPFFLKKIRQARLQSNGIVVIPSNFSFIDNEQECIDTFQRMLSALFVENLQSVHFDYTQCKNVSLGTQALFDIILREYDSFLTRSKKANVSNAKLFPNYFGGQNINEQSVKEMIWSVGSPANLNIGEFCAPTIERFKLRTYSDYSVKDEQTRRDKKELDTTEMIDYVVNSLRRMGKKLTPKKLDDLCTIIGEVLINAEEHSTTRHRFSIGYFKEEQCESNHFGIFRLVILNFGATIYEKFKAPDCPNQDYVQRMQELSQKYTRRNFFVSNKFDEECLWTLYALQEGVTSVSTNCYKRGNGSIRFIESFFNLKGTDTVDNQSRMTIISGRTKILFDGKYHIVEKINTNGEKFKRMTFNNTGNIEDMPDASNVMFMKNYFPGTIISAEILLTDNDVKTTDMQ